MINKKTIRYLYKSAFGKRLQRKGRLWFYEAIEILKESNYKVKIIKGKEKGILKFVIVPTKIAPDFWLFSCITKQEAFDFIEKMEWDLVKDDRS